MKDYLSRYIGKKVELTRMGVPREVSIVGTLKEIVGPVEGPYGVAVVVDDNGDEIGIPLDKILVVGPTEEGKESRKAGFIGEL